VASGRAQFLLFRRAGAVARGAGELRPREIYRSPEGWSRGAGFSVSEDGLYAFLVETGRTAAGCG